MPFDEDEDVPLPKKGVKFTNQKSIFAEMPKKLSAEDHQQKVNEINSRSQEYSQRAAELTSQFLKMVDDKTLSQNKSVFVVDIEKETVSKLIKLGIDINTDENQPEGMGSVGLISILFRSLLSQRDKINNLEYSLSLLNKEIINLKSGTLDSKKKDE